MSNGNHSAESVSPLRAVRIAHGRGLRSTAREAGLDPGHYSRIERGQVAPTVDTLKRIADVLGLDELSSFLAPYVREEAA